MIVTLLEQCNYEHEIRAMKLTASLSIARAADHKSFLAPTWVVAVLCNPALL
jgi:hypothetical protein